MRMHEDRKQCSHVIYLIMLTNERYREYKDSAICTIEHCPSGLTQARLERPHA